MAFNNLRYGNRGQFWANLLTPNWGFKRIKDIRYGHQKRQKLDLYSPKKRIQNAPVIVFFYGGSWQSGSRKNYKFIGQALASKGFIVAIPDYRIYPNACFPEFVKDGAKVVSWVYKNAQEHGGLPNNIFLMGHSAGAYIGAMLAADTQYLTDVGLHKSIINGFIGLAGPYDFLPITNPVLQTIFAPQSRWSQTQPINYIQGTEAPMLLMHGDRDTTVAVKNSRSLTRKIHDLGGQAKLIVYTKTNHVQLIAPLATPMRWRGSQLEDINHFINTKKREITNV